MVDTRTRCTLKYSGAFPPCKPTQYTSATSQAFLSIRHTLNETKHRADQAGIEGSIRKG